MLALVTCHIFPPSIWYGKKWLPGTWLPGWRLAVFQSPRLHECGPADAHGNAQPFCMDKCIFRKKTPVLQFGHTLEQNSSICPIISYLWMVDLVMRFFSCGASLWRSSTRIRPKKRSSPLDFIFDTCASASSSHLFLVGEAEHMCFSCMISLQKIPVFLLHDFSSGFEPSFPGDGRQYSEKKDQYLFFFFFYPEVWPYIAWQSPFIFAAWYMFKFLATNLGNSTNLPVIRVIHDWFPDALHTQTDRSTPPQSQQTEINFLSLYVRKLSGKKSGPFFGMIFFFLAPYHAPGPSPTVC